MAAVIVVAAVAVAASTEAAVAAAAAAAWAGNQTSVGIASGTYHEVSLLAADWLEVFHT